MVINAYKVLILKSKFCQMLFLEQVMQQKVMARNENYKMYIGLKYINII